jgi:hypothetical protein
MYKVLAKEVVELQGCQFANRTGTTLSPSSGAQISALRLMRERIEIIWVKPILLGTLTIDV